MALGEVALTSTASASQASVSVTVGPDGNVLLDYSATTSASDSALFMQVREIHHIQYLISFRAVSRTETPANYSNKRVDQRTQPQFAPDQPVLQPIHACR
jgi:hypothetical protein